MQIRWCRPRGDSPLRAGDGWGRRELLMAERVTVAIRLAIEPLAPTQAGKHQGDERG